MLDEWACDLLDVLLEHCDCSSSLALSATSATLRASTTTASPAGPLLRVAHTTSRALNYHRVMPAHVTSVTLDSFPVHRVVRRDGASPRLPARRRSPRLLARTPVARQELSLLSCRTLLWRLDPISIERVRVNETLTSEVLRIVGGLRARLVLVPAGTRLSARDGHCAVFLETCPTLEASRRPPPPLVPHARVLLQAEW